MEISTKTKTEFSLKIKKPVDIVVHDDEMAEDSNIVKIIMGVFGKTKQESSIIVNTLRKEKIAVVDTFSSKEEAGGKVRKANKESNNYGYKKLLFEIKQ